MDERARYADEIRTLRDELVFNLTRSARVGAEYIANLAAALAEAKRPGRP